MIWHAHRPQSANPPLRPLFFDQWPAIAFLTFPPASVTNVGSHPVNPYLCSSAFASLKTTTTVEHGNLQQALEHCNHSQAGSTSQVCRPMHGIQKTHHRHMPLYFCVTAVSPSWSMLSSWTATDPRARLRRCHWTFPIPSGTVVTCIQCIVSMKYSRRERDRHRSQVNAGRTHAQSWEVRRLATDSL
jgi:hypothetical protein